MPKYSRSWKASAEGQACATVTTVFVADSGKRSVMIGILRICPLAAVNSQHTIQATYFRACERGGCLLLWSARAPCVSGDRGLAPLDGRLSSFLELSRMSRIVAYLPDRVRNSEGGVHGLIFSIHRFSLQSSKGLKTLKWRKRRGPIIYPVESAASFRANMHK